MPQPQQTHHSPVERERVRWHANRFGCLADAKSVCLFVCRLVVILFADTVLVRLCVSVSAEVFAGVNV